MNRSLLTFALFLINAVLFAQAPYRYSVNLNAIKNDKLHVTLLTPLIKSETVVYAFPKIIPGTYSISNYGKFVDSLRAFDAKGKLLKVTRLDENQWKISDAKKLTKIIYLVDDIFDSATKHNVYPMSATNIEEQKNYVLHTPGFFGYFNEVRQTPVELSVEKPQNFYASTSLTPTSSTATTDLFKAGNIDELYDSPIMYTVPDTANIQVGNCNVLVSVYSPNKQISSKEISGWLNDLLQGAKNYLGGKLPADKYAFIFYFRDPKVTHSFPPGLGGALEHTTSSFYYLGEAPADQLRSSIVDIASHEFFHIVTPLTIASQEIKQFNFNEAVLSKHLWLYEGSTEYTSHHVQVQQGLKSVPGFLGELSQKITNSKNRYNDSLSFTELSKLAATIHEEQYGNVYDKGALITACLDLILLDRSGGNYSFKNLTHDLGVRYGRTRAFNDDELFNVIAELSYPEAKDFLIKYVQGSNTPIPYDYYFGLAGVKYTPLTQKKVVSFGGIMPALNPKGILFVSENSKFNEFGKKFGYQIGDELYSFNGQEVTPNTFADVLGGLRTSLKEGDFLKAKIGRTNAGGKIDTLILSAPVYFITQADENKLDLIENPTSKQLAVRNAWLKGNHGGRDETPSPKANPQDVGSIDAIIKSLYGVISGPAGERNWNRFHSLFLPGATLGAVGATPTGEQRYFSFTSAEYQKNNAPYFAQNGFFESEVSRKVSNYGNVASVQSAYQSRSDEKGKVVERGINYLTLVKSNGRWWISSLTWQEESKENPLPKEFLKK
ncbi:MAG TPA: hypothetical protein VF602_07985 [Pedobacter sp.]